MKPTSKSDLDNLGEWYLKSQLEIDKLVINKKDTKNINNILLANHALS